MSQQNIHAGRTATLFVVILLSVALFVFLAWLYTGEKNEAKEGHSSDKETSLQVDADRQVLDDETPVVTHMGSVVRTNGEVITILPVDETVENGEQSFSIGKNVITKHYSLSAEKYFKEGEDQVTQGDLIGFEVRKDVVVSKTHFVE